MTSFREAPQPDPEFDQAYADLAVFHWDPSVTITEVPAPKRLAPFSIAFEADLNDGLGIVGTGRLVLLHNPDRPAIWDGSFRCVSYIQSDADMEMVLDPLLAEVGWSWLIESLNKHGALHAAPSGTVTAMSSRGFGDISTDPDRAEIEIRASWTALIDADHSFADHLKAWQDLLRLSAGLPPVVDGVVSIQPRLGALQL